MKLKTATDATPNTIPRMVCMLTVCHKRIRIASAVALVPAVIVSVLLLLCCAPTALAAEQRGQITGKVTDAATQAGVGGLEVCARQRPDRFGGDCARTGQNGEYKIAEVPAGTYVVEFLVPFVGGPESTPSALDYASQYYDGKATQAEAEEVTVTAGQTTSGIDAAMRPGGKIAGVVTDAVTRDPIAGIEVCAYSPTAVEDLPSRCVETGPDGEYAIGSLISREYVVEFSAPANGPLEYAPQYYDDRSWAEEPDEVRVTAGETTPGIDAAMQSGGTISGQVTVAATGSPLMNADVCAFSVATLSVRDETPERCVQTNANGEYTLSQLVDGQDIVEFRDEFGAGFVLQYYDDKSLLSEADPLSVTPGATITGVDAAMHAVGEVKEEKTEPPRSTETTLSAGLASATPPLIQTAPLVTVATSKLMVAKGGTRVLVSCSRAACQGSAELVEQVLARGPDGKAMVGRAGVSKKAADRRTLVLATGSFSLTEGRSESVLLRLTPAGRRRLAHTRRHRLAARLVLSVDGGGTVSWVVGVG